MKLIHKAMFELQAGECGHVSIKHFDRIVSVDKQGCQLAVWYVIDTDKQQHRELDVCGVETGKQVPSSAAWCHSKTLLLHDESYVLHIYIRIV